MKSEHRHELKTNELAQWIADFPQWAKKNMRMIIYVSVAVIVVVAYYAWYDYRKNVVLAQQQERLTSLLSKLAQSKQEVLRVQSQGQDYSFILNQIANELDDFAQKAENEQAAALALTKKAEALRIELHYRLVPADEQNAAEQINRAKSDYSRAIEMAHANPSLKAIATYGLGLCEEELGNFDQARQIYQQITEDAAFQGTVAVVLSENRLKIMEDYREKVAFKAPEMKPPMEIEPSPFDTTFELDAEQSAETVVVDIPNLPANQ